jgi:hypothetical protein
VSDYFKVIYHTKNISHFFQPIINWNKPISRFEPESLMRTRVLSIKLSQSWNTDRLTKSKTLNYFPTYISLKILVENVCWEPWCYFFFIYIYRRTCYKRIHVKTPQKNIAKYCSQSIFCLLYSWKLPNSFFVDHNIAKVYLYPFSCIFQAMIAG